MYGKTRDGAMFGLGYVAAEDRLFFMDALRNAGRGALSSFAGGANITQDEEQWEVAPYTEADLQQQDEPPPGFPATLAATISSDADNYIAGINQYINEAKLDPTKMPGEYAALGHPQGRSRGSAPTSSRPPRSSAGSSARAAATRSRGPRSSTRSTLASEEARAKGVFKDFRSAEDPEAPTTVLGKKRFTYQAPPKKLGEGSRAISGAARSSSSRSWRGGRPRDRGSAAGRCRRAARVPEGASNAMLVSARESADGKPLMVAGPQVAYFNPQILMEQDVHAPASPASRHRRPRRLVHRAEPLRPTRPRARLRVERDVGRARTTSTPTRVPTCRDTMHYVYRGRCLPVEVLDRVNAWQPSAGDSTPAGSETLRALRTKLGIVAGRAIRRQAGRC